MAVGVVSLCYRVTTTTITSNVGSLLRLSH